MRDPDLGGGRTAGARHRPLSRRWAGGAVAQTVQEATTPTSTVEVGAGVTTDGSYKAGEYNGLQNKGLFGIGQLDFRGGGAFDSDNAMRWRIKGSDLGLDTRSINAEFGKQGTYRVFGGYDELRRNRSDTYQTPYNGAGTNVLTLPGAWQVPTVAGSTGHQQLRERRQRARPRARDRRRPLHRRAHDFADLRRAADADGGADRRWSTRRPRPMCRSSTTTTCRPRAPESTSASTTTSIRSGASTRASGPSTRTASSRWARCPATPAPTSRRRSPT